MLEIVAKELIRIVIIVLVFYILSNGAKLTILSPQAVVENDNITSF